MSVLTATFFGLCLAGAFGVLSVREHRALRRSRWSLLDECKHILGGAEIRHGSDGFPRLLGSHCGNRVHLELIPDTMVLRRLPQLWASLTLIDSLVGVPSLAILVRPAGYEFYSLTSSLSCALDPPTSFPSEVLVRGSDARAAQLLEQLSPQLATILADPRVKEIAVTNRGLRVISQVGEGRRGEHLLLRQAVFDDASVQPNELAKRLEELEGLWATLGRHEWKLAA
ncbi:MAG: hypothetical protein R3D30_13915 [Hyphomicrobiales bacterium]